MSETQPGFETQALHAGQVADPTTKSLAVPIYMTTSFEFDSPEHAANLFALKEFGNIYTRIMNPTTDVFEKRIAALEGGAMGLAFASGQAAEVAAIQTLAGAGDQIVSTTSLYGGTFNLFNYTLPRMGIDVAFADSSAESIKSQITDKTKAIYSETLGNPDFLTLDIEAVAKVAHDAGVPLIIDNTIPTPYLVRPLDHGADIVVHSATKFIGGHGAAIGGVLVDGGKFDWGASGRFPDFTEPDPSYHGIVFNEVFGPANFGANIAFAIRARTQLLRDTGGALSPFNAWLFVQGLESLAVRVERHSQNAQAVASFLNEHPKVSWVNYPGMPTHPAYKTASKYFRQGLYGAMLGFGVRGGLEAGKALIEHVKLFSHVANFGDSKSLIIHPASTTHSQLTEEEQISTGTTPDFIRLSVGLETVSDIIADLDQALAQI